MTDELQIPTIQWIHMKICKRQILETADPDCYPSGIKTQKGRECVHGTIKIEKSYFLKVW